MDGLCILIENVTHDIELLIKECQFDAEQYDKLLKPWPVAMPIASKQSFFTPNENSRTPENTDDKFQKELEKVEHILQKARLLREQKDSPLTSQRSKSTKVENKEKCKECLRHTCQKHKQLQPTQKSTRNSAVIVKPRTAKTQKSQNRTSPHISQVASKQLVRASSASVTSIKTITAKEKNNECGDGLKNKLYHIKADIGSSSGQPVDAPVQKPKLTIDLEDISEQRSLPKKLKKLHSMHCKLTKQKIISSSATDVPTSAENNFISKLMNAKDQEDWGDGMDKIPDNMSSQSFLTADAAKLVMESCIKKCTNLTNFLSTQTHLINDRSDAVKLYQAKLVFAHANGMLQEIDESYDWIKHCAIVDPTKTSLNEPIPSLALPSCDPDLLAPACMYLKFKTSLELARHSQLSHELLWVKLSLLLHTKLHDVLGILLREMPSDSNQFSTEFAKCVAIATGLLTKKYRCSNNPAIVCDE